MRLKSEACNLAYACIIVYVATMADPCSLMLCVLVIVYMSQLSEPSHCMWSALIDVQSLWRMPGWKFECWMLQPQPSPSWNISDLTFFYSHRTLWSDLSLTKCHSDIIPLHILCNFLSCEFTCLNSSPYFFPIKWPTCLNIYILN